VPPTTAERIYQELRELVVTGELAPGDRLVQRQLASRLGVSSIPVVEAMRRLEHDGLVISHPNWGVQVREWTEWDIEGAYLAREALEGIACRLFVDRAGAVERAQLVQHATRFAELIRQRDAAGWLQADLALHSHIVRSTQAHSLIHTTEGSCLITLTLQNAHRRILGRGTDFPEPTVHDEMVEALCGTDKAAAERAGRAHVRNAYERLMALSAETSPAAAG
jgi:DNA-binding GntR family transcriptional regulator